MRQTSKVNFNLPEYTDVIDIENINENFETIDGMLGAAGGIATLDENGMVPAAQLPEMDYIPAAEKGVPGGVATLDENGMLVQGGGSSTTMFIKDLTIGASDFVTYTPATGTEEEKLHNVGYVRRADVSVENALEVMTPEAIFSLADIENSGVNIASQVSTHDGGIYVYSDGVPANDIKILNLILSWSDKLVNVDDFLTAEDIGAVSVNQLGVPGGVATLDENGELVQGGGGGNGNSLYYQGLSFATDSFVTFSAEDSEEQKLIDAGYTYRASIAIDRVLEEMIPEVTISLIDLDSSGIEMSNMFRCYDGGVYGYANGIPSNDIGVLTLEVSWNEIDPDIAEMLTPEVIGAAGKSRTITTTLLADNWVDGVYNLEVTGVTATSNQELTPAVGITQEELEALQAANIQDAGQSTGVISLKAFGDIPTIDLPIRLILRGDA